MKNKIFTIMFTEISWNSSLKSDWLDNFIETQSNIIIETSNLNKWIFVKKIWEWFMYIFNNPTIALVTATEIQKNLKSINKTAFWIKIGINTWEVQYINDYSFEKNKKLIDVFWTPVNIASRVKWISNIWEVFFTQNTLLNMDNSILYTRVWYKILKWIKGKIQIFKVNQNKELDINKIEYLNSFSWTIMNTDIVWYTDKVSWQTRLELADFIKNQKNIFDPIIAFNKWQVIKTIWDAYVILFESPTNALLAAKQIQDKIKNYNSRVLDNKKWFKIRIWINTWEIHTKDWEFKWNTLNISEELESITEPWNIYFTEYTRININKQDINYFKILTKNIRWKKINIYKLDIWEYSIFYKIRRYLKKFLSKLLDLILKITITLIIIIIILTFIFQYLKHRENNSTIINNSINSTEEFIDKKIINFKTKYKIFKIKYL